MAKRSFLLCIFFVFLFITSKSQISAAAKGKILDHESKLPISNAGVQVIKKNKIVYNTNSDTSGYFSIPYNALRSIITLKITHLSYNSSEFLVDSSKTVGLNKISFLGIFELNTSTIHLEEVVIKKSRRYRDTLSIDLSKEIFERSIMIDDLFSQKGLFKDENGKLFYKGNPVSDILVNGGDFFGKNNLDIYKYLPALTLDNIEIVETNIDSLTHTTLLTPIVKLNLKLKDKFKKGQFGGLNLGYGTLSRYLFATDLYNYKNSEQISLVLNTNNINSSDNPYIESNVNLSTNVNNSIVKSAKLSYRNLYYKNRIEVKASVKGRAEEVESDFETLRNEKNFNQFSRTTNKSKSTSYGIEAANLSVNYRINSLNTFTIQQLFDVKEIKQFDSLDYIIESEKMNTASRMRRARKQKENFLSKNIAYQKLFESKRGRILDIEYTSYRNRNNLEEDNSVFSRRDEVDDLFFIRGSRHTKQQKANISVAFTEPFGEKSYLKNSFSYYSEKINYDATRTSDTLSNFNESPFEIDNKYLSQDLTFKHTLEKISLGGNISGIINFRKISQDFKVETNRLLLINANLNTEYKINSKKKLSANYIRNTNYPTINQLTAINNTFDLVSQMKENVRLKPEIKNRAMLSYEYRKSDSLILSLIAGTDFYTSKFGFNTTNNSDASYQTTFIDNIGKSKSYDLSLSISRNSSNGKSISYRFGIDYTDEPIIINQQINTNTGLQINQALGMGFSLLKILTMSPSLASTVAQYNYRKTKSKLLSLTYSDRISLSIPGKLLLNMYPIVNYSYNIDHAATWSVNAEVARDIFKKYGRIWVRAYDMFNSFNYVSNYLGSSYSQSVKFENLNRYIIIGLNMKFNDMK